MKVASSYKIKDCLFLLFVAILAYWPVSFMLFSVKNDAINYFLAIRYNTSEAIQHGYFPSWSAYINMGYPLHGDMQSGVWNPIVFLMSLIRKYDIYWLQIETIITIFVAGLSMYHLLKYFRLDRKVILAVSAAYMMNGYITDAGQFLNWLYAASFLPFVFLCAIRCFNSFTIKNAFLLGLAYSLMLLCSYPADFILLSYLLAIYFIISFYKYAKQNGLKDAFKKPGRQALIAAVSFFIICIPAILSYIPFIGSINRGRGVDIQTALSNSLAPANLISFIVPWATQRGSIFSATDPLIRNCYLGVILFIFFIFFFIQKKQKTFTQKFLIGTFIFFLIFSLGELGGIRVLSYKFLPLMNTFRHPANAKLFFIFSGQIIAAFGIHEYLNSSSLYKRKLQSIIVILLGLMSIALITGLLKSNILHIINSNGSKETLSIADKLKAIKDNLSFYDLLFLNSSFILLILIFFYRTTTKHLSGKYFLSIILIEMFVIAQGMIPLTYARKLSPATVQKILDRQPEGYPLPDPFISIEKYSKDGMKYFNEIGCLNPYNKKPGRSDYIISPANLSSQEFFWNYTSFRKKIIQYPLAYFADTIYSVKDISSFVSGISSKKAVILDSINGANPNEILEVKRELAYKKFIPGAITITTETNKAELLVLLQNYYPSWVVYVNGQKKPIIKTNLSFMGVWLPAGENEISFIYNAGIYKNLGIFSLLFVLTGLAIISVKSKMKNE